MPEKENWYYSVPGVLVLLFFVLGPLALPLLFKNPKFNQLSKILLTTLVVVVTIFLSSLIIKTLKDFMVQMQQLEMMLK